MTSLKRRPWFLLLTLLMITGASTARADEVDVLYGQGQTAFDAGKFEEARAKFALVWAQRKSFDVAAVLAQTELQVGRNCDAAQHLAYAIAHFPVSANGDMRKKLEAAFTDVRAKVGAIKVEVSPASAALKVNGQSYAGLEQGVPIFVELGQVTVEASAPDYLPAKRTVSVEQATEPTVQITLEKDPASRDTGTGPRKEVLIAGGAVAGVAAITGAVMLGVSAAKLSEATELRDEVQAGLGRKACGPASTEPRCKTQADALSLSDTLGNAGTWSLIGAGLVAAGTVTYALVTRSPRAPTTVQAGFFWTPQGSGAIVRARF